MIRTLQQQQCASAMSIVSSASASASGLALKRRARGGRRYRGGGIAAEIAATRVNAQCATDLDLPPRLEAIVNAFQMVPDPMQRYKQLLYYADKLPPLGAEHQTDANKVKGCVSQVWVLVTLSDDGTVELKAESDSALTKGLAALLVEGLTGATPEEVMDVEAEFIEELGLKQSLTPSRNNGFLNMLKLIQSKCAVLDAAQAAASGGGSNSCDRQEVTTTTTTRGGDELSVRDSMVSKIEAALSPTELVVVDESDKHAGHAGSPGGGETHFRLEIISDAFEGATPVKRHRMVYELLDAEFARSLHALSLVTKTSEEAKASN